MNKLIIMLFVTLLATMFAIRPAMAANQPVLTVYTNLEESLGKPVTSRQVEEALKQCSAHRGWKFTKTGSGQLVGKLVVRGKHYVEVGVEYNSTAFKITYRDSKNMRYNAGADTIHKRYNSWVTNLSDDVQFCLK